jgi:hypothetical protein
MSTATHVFIVEGRLYNESMATPSAGTTTGQATDEVELTKMRRQQYWSQVQRLKLLMDLIFVCASGRNPIMNLTNEITSVRCLPHQTIQQYCQNSVWSGVCHLEVNVRNDHPQSSDSCSSSMKLYNKHHGTLSRSVV